MMFRLQTCVKCKCYKILVIDIQRELQIIVTKENTKFYNVSYNTFMAYLVLQTDYIYSFHLHLFVKGIASFIHYQST